jgi:hypothetical protein
VITIEDVATELLASVVVNWPIPINVKQLRGFWGLTSYYKCFIKHYGMISSPMTHLLRRGVPFVWTDTTQQAFDILMQAMVQAPMLIVPDFNKLVIQVLVLS